MGHSFNCLMRLGCGLFVLAGVLISCWTDGKDDRKEKPISVKESPKITSDSFDIVDLRDIPSIQEGILLDTTELKSAKHIWATIIIPKVSRKDYPAVVKYIDSLEKSKRKEFYEDIKEVGYDPSDSVREDEGWYNWLYPLEFYRSDRVINIVFEDGAGHSGMPSSFEFQAFNYDLIKKKRIAFGDYFKMQSTSDTLFWMDIISRSVSTDMENKLKFLEW